MPFPPKDAKKLLEQLHDLSVLASKCLMGIEALEDKELEDGDIIDVYSDIEGLVGVDKKAAALIKKFTSVKASVVEAGLYPQHSAQKRAHDQLLADLQGVKEAVQTLSSAAKTGSPEGPLSSPDGTKELLKHAEDLNVRARQVGVNLGRFTHR